MSESVLSDEQLRLIVSATILRTHGFSIDEAVREALLIERLMQQVLRDGVTPDDSDVPF